MEMRGFSKISGKVQRKKNPKFSRTAKHAQEQSPAKFLNCHGDRNSKNCELLFNNNKTNGKENKCMVSRTFLCAAISSFNATFSAGISTSIVAHSHLVQLEVVCMSFPGRLSVPTSVHTTKCQKPMWCTTFIIRNYVFFTRRMHAHFRGRSKAQYYIFSGTHEHHSP
jgi:hypothetical protein